METTIKVTFIYVIHFRLVHNLSTVLSIVAGVPSLTFHQPVRY